MASWGEYARSFQIKSEDDEDSDSMEPPKLPTGKKAEKQSWAVLSYTKALNGDRISLLPERPPNGTEGLLSLCKKLLRSFVGQRYGTSTNTNTKSLLQRTAPEITRLRGASSQILRKDLLLYILPFFLKDFSWVTPTKCQRKMSWKFMTFG